MASVLEVLLITMQRWRGVPSHFNDATAFDSAVFSAMGLLRLAGGADDRRRHDPLVRHTDAPASLAWAIRIGLVLLLASQVVGMQMIAEGGNTFGAAGALKVPHAFTLHALQVLPALALLLVIAEYTERQRLEIIALGGIGYGALIASTMAQTYAGLAPTELGILAVALAVSGLVVLAVCLGVTARGIAHHIHPPPTGHLPSPAG